jgi:DNA-binding LytR/AlgR family response regulator
MIRTIIIEDEQIATDNLLYYLGSSGEPISVVACLESIEDAVAWLSTHALPDLVFMDIYLKDGISFSIFEKIRLQVPIIFITAFDNFMLQAFEQTGIEYLLKPINQEALSKAIAKYKTLQQHFLHNQAKLVEYLSAKDSQPKTRIIAKKGIEFISVQLDDAAYFFTDQKVSFLVTREGKKFLVNKTLKELEEELDPKKFYRANRKYIIHINCIKSYKATEKVKIALELTVPVAEEIIISQESAIDFRRWISSL